MRLPLEGCVCYDMVDFSEQDAIEMCVCGCKTDSACCRRKQQVKNILYAEEKWLCKGRRKHFEHLSRVK